jgi:acyl-CoA synthetase (NDP forming)/L-amino acid N-acyltransferase YncA
MATETVPSAPVASPARARPRDPESWACDVLLRDGATMHLRALRSSDRDALNALHERSSERSHYRRFFNAMPHLNKSLLDRLSNVDQIDRVALVCENPYGICAVGRYDRTPGASIAEVAFDVDDMNQGRGLGTLLLEHLVVIARERGIEKFEALVLAENQEMLGMFKRSGYVVSTHFDDPGVRRVVIDLRTTTNSVDARYDREAVSVLASIRRAFEPKSIALVGATDTVGRPGRALMANLVDTGFTGELFPINPKHGIVGGLRAYRRVTDVKQPIDLAVIVVPAEQVEQVVADCADAHVGALVIVSAGFAELGVDGRNRQDRVLRLARLSGMRVVGPNCLGIANLSHGVMMNATFASLALPAGAVGVMTQSGAVGIELVHGLGERGLGISSFASVGNKADISGNDLLTYWEQDANTRQIVLYLESFGNPQAFARIAPRVAHRKPILAIKSGRTAAAATAATSHTAALALPDRAVDALLEQSGVLRLDSVDELIDVCAALDSQPLPAGRRVAIVTNAGGPAILAADVCDPAGVELATFSDATLRFVSTELGRAVGQGPLDLRADASPDIMLRVLTTVANDPGVDAVVVIIVDVSGIGLDSYARSCAAITFDGPPKPLLLSVVPSFEGKLAGLPVFQSAERAIGAIGRLCERRRWLDETTLPEALDAANALTPDSVVAVRRLVDTAMTARPDGGWMTNVDGFALIEALGIDVARPAYATSASEAVRAAQAAGYPVVLKVDAEDVVHRSDRGGVQTNLRSADDVMRAYRVLAGEFSDAMRGGFVQPMSAPGVELLAGIVSHRDLGPVIVVGEGGTLTELRHDTALRRPPLTKSEATRQLHSLKVAGLLTGFRDRPPVDESAVVDALLRLGQLAQVAPEIAELDINPLIATPKGVCAVDVKIRLLPAELPLAESVRVLRT